MHLLPAYLVLQVLMPNGAYSGQNETKEVRTKIPAKASKMIPKVPGIVPVKYKAAMMMARTTRTARSTLPMFFFMMVGFRGWCESIPKANQR